MRWLPWRDLLGLGSGLALVLFWSLVTARLVMYPENHTGVSVLWALPLAMVTMLAGWLWLAAHRRRAGTALLVLGLLTAGGAVLLDRLDILVEYEEWLKRGMPERPFQSIRRESVQGSLSSRAGGNAPGTVSPNLSNSRTSS